MNKEEAIEVAYLLGCSPIYYMGEWTIE